MGKSDVSCSNFGTKEWAAKNANIITGCIHNCSYCYARASAARFKRVAPGEWHKEVIRSEAGKKRYKKYDKPVMYPTAHDISVKNLDASITEIRNILKPGNLVLIVSKPHLVCIKKICEEFKEQKDNILFRFSIGSADDKVLKFWEEFAPKFSERLESLKWAHKEGFSTSVSCEPMLDNQIERVVSAVHPYVTDKIWLGKANHFPSNLQHNKCDDKAHVNATKRLKEWQSNENIKKLYEQYKGDMKIAWKESIKKVVGVKLSAEQQEDEMMGGFKAYASAQQTAQVPKDIVRQVAEHFLSQSNLETDEDRFNLLIDSLRAMVVVDSNSQEVTMDLWSEVDSIPISEASKEDKIFIPVKLNGKISDVSEPAPIFVDGRAIQAHTFTITDRNGHSIAALPVPETMTSSHVINGAINQKVYSFLGGVLATRSIRSNKGKYYFFVSGIRDDVAAWDLIDERPTGSPASGHSFRLSDGKVIGIPDDHPYLLMSQHKGTNSLLGYIKDQLVSMLQIKGLSKARELDRSIDFMILQAFSQGVGTYSEKLHSLVIGPPNVGKGFLTKIALILNPVAQEVASNSGKVTEAGLVGAVKKSGKGSVSKPGILPNNSGGTVCIQEFHDIKGRERLKLFAVFSRLMEEGVVIDSTTGNTLHPAATSLHLDENRLTDVHPNRSYDPLEDIGIPINILSRFDFIQVFPKDAKRQTEVAALMTNIGKMGGAKIGDDRARRLKMLVAWMRTQYSVVTFSDDVNKYIKSEMEKAIAPLMQDDSSAKMVQDFQLRLVNSLHKLVKAIACTNATTDATKEHVDYAVQFVRSKLDFIGSIDWNKVKGGHLRIDDKAARQNLILDKFKQAKSFKLKDIMEVVKSAMEGDVTDKTIKRDLADLGAESVKHKKGLWKWR
ncbi:MAG: hypothetical protein JRN15_13785 [Nitrososphaerota archaeon]|nr:hypothetical protein [Nitrososphaerota archaeon]